MSHLALVDGAADAEAGIDAPPTFDLPLTPFPPIDLPNPNAHELPSVALDELPKDRTISHYY